MHSQNSQLSNRLECFHEIKSFFIGIPPQIILCATKMGEIRTLQWDQLLQIALLLPIFPYRIFCLWPKLLHRDCVVLHDIQVGSSVILLFTVIPESLCRRIQTTVPEVIGGRHC
jgi:hypothetical protein